VEYIPKMDHIPKMVRRPENHTVSCSVIHWGYDFFTFKMDSGFKIIIYAGKV
jgi:hypothetical protein